MQRAYQNGAVIAGSSAGAMVMCEFYYDPEHQRLQPGLNFVPNACVLPHHNTFGKNWAARLTQLLPQARLLGVDEQTGMLSDDGTHWRVSGRGGVTIYVGGASKFYKAELSL
jgi:cyanophycinase